MGRVYKVKPVCEILGISDSLLNTMNQSESNLGCIQYVSFHFVFIYTVKCIVMFKCCNVRSHRKCDWQWPGSWCIHTDAAAAAGMDADTACNTANNTVNISKFLHPEMCSSTPRFHVWKVPFMSNVPNSSSRKKVSVYTVSLQSTQGSLTGKDLCLVRRFKWILHACCS